MDTKLKRVKVETTISGHYDLAIEYTTIRKIRLDWFDEFRKVPIQRFLIAALNQNIVAVSKYQGAKAIPLWFENPVAAGR